MKHFLFSIIFLALFVGKLHSESFKKTHESLEQAFASPRGLVPLSIDQGASVLIVHGLNPLAEAHLWIEPLEKLKALKKNLFLHGWSKFRSLEENKKELMNSIDSLIKNHPGESLTILGYSAGGTLALLAKEELHQNSVPGKLDLHTIAAPLFGYNAPKLAHLGSPFVGATAIALGRGIYKNTVSSPIENCQHWITTNCDLDKHACARKGILPQEGRNFGMRQELPCGFKNTHYFNNETHQSIIMTAIRSIFSLNQ